MDASKNTGGLLGDGSIETAILLPEDAKRLLREWLYSRRWSVRLRRWVGQGLCRIGRLIEGNTCEGTEPHEKFDRKEYQRLYMRKYRQRKAK